DELLNNVAHRLQRCLRTKDKIARFGGDEFAILLENIHQSQEVTRVAERIQERLRLPFKLDYEQVFTGASIGITFSSIGYERPEDLLRDADVAMYQAKAQGKGRYAVFNPGMQIAALARLQLENDLRQAIEQQEFCLHYQPIISLSTGCLTSFEALIRWNHSSRGWVSPAEFIPIAEETGLINDIGWWVFQEACRQLQVWKQQFAQASALMINVNLSTHQLKQVGLVEKIEKILHASEIEGREVRLEITESCFLETVASETAMVSQLKALGISLCIDDFGTGYSSLSRLHEFPIDTLKIDRSFIRRLELNQTAIVQTIVTLAHSLEMNVVAEGIETKEQLKKLQLLGCELGQGYLFSQPVNSQIASQLISDKGKMFTVNYEDF
ncbi:MAG: putative bifunctional diguanylate cyclase/phosphodiesterase, partial [Microcystaceae cyanobacterium]